MRWISKPEPEKGDKKVVTKFLWFPVCINHDCRWLEKATIEYKFAGWDYGNYDCWEWELWIPKKFIDV